MTGEVFPSPGGGGGQPSAGPPPSTQPFGLRPANGRSAEGAPAAGGGSASGDNGLPVIAHLLGLFTGVLGTLILYLAIRDDPPARQHASTALNWQLSLVLYLLGSGVLLGLVSIAVPPVLLLFPLVMLGLVLACLVLCTVGAVKAGNGERFTYPAAIPFTRGG